MLPYSEVFHVLLHGCWPNLTKMWIPLAEEPKILFLKIFYGLENRTIHTLIQVSHLIHTINLWVSMLLVFPEMLCFRRDSLIFFLLHVAVIVCSHIGVHHHWDNMNWKSNPGYDGRRSYIIWFRCYVPCIGALCKRVVCLWSATRIMLLWFDKAF